MKRKVLTVFLAFVMLLGLAIPGGSTRANAATQNGDNPVYAQKIDLGAKLRKLDKDPKVRAKYDQKIRESAASLAASGALPESTGIQSTLEPGATRLFPAYDNGTVYLKQFSLKQVGINCEVWLADSLSFGKGDKRPAPVITDAQLEKVKNEFDNNIYAKDTEFFGMPDSHTGINATLPGKAGLSPDYYAYGSDKAIILVDNVRDEAYYDASYPFFTAGFYWGIIEEYTDRNVITIDTNSWETRLENTFLPTIAHEFQHLIHDDNDPDEETWINEGMADFASFLCGYGHDWSSIDYFLAHPENSIINWDEYYDAATGPETIADYAQAYLFQLYLNDHYGQSFIQTLAKSTSQGIESVNEILSKFNTGIDFSELFKRYTVALAVDDTKLDGGIYGFNSIDLKVNYEGAAANAKPGIPAWGADYIRLDDASSIKSVSFNGIKYAPTPWQVVNDPKKKGNKVLWGNKGDEKDNQLIFEADLTGLAGQPVSLSFDNYISIEEQWDYGFVQVSADGGKTWASLKNANTRTDIDAGGYPAIGQNLPGFTGYYKGWTRETFNLSSFAGQKIFINFRYMTDWGYNDAGWFIDNISIPEIKYNNTCDTLDGFKSIQEVNEVCVEYALSFINDLSGRYSIKNIGPFNITELQTIDLSRFFKGGNGYMVVWYAAPKGAKDPMPYTYTINRK